MNPPGVIPVRKEHIQTFSIAGWKAISYKKVLQYPIAPLILLLFKTKLSKITYYLNDI